MVTCLECKSTISDKAITCPTCGAPVPKKKGFGMLTLLVCSAVIIWIVWPDAPQPTRRPVLVDQNASNAVATAEREEVIADSRNSVQAYFKSDSEPSVLDAAWTSDTVFKVGVLDDGTPRDGFADYVCSILSENGLQGGYTVQVNDIASISRGGEWTVLGSAICP